MSSPRRSVPVPPRRRSCVNPPVPAPTLPELQALFWRALHGPVGPALEEAVVSTPTLGAGQRLGIYAGMYFSRLRDVLAEDFEKTAAVLGTGTDGFDAVVRRYLAAHPSEHPSVRHVGQWFPVFLASSPPPGTPPWLSDLARLEWARVEVFDAPDVTPVRVDELRGIGQADWPGLRLRSVAALQVVESA